MSGPNQSDNQRGEESSANSHSTVEVHIPKSVKKKLEEQSRRPATIRYQIKSVIAVKESGLPLFHIEMDEEESETEVENASVLSGLTSALWHYASQTVHQDIQELSLEDDKVVFLADKETETILGVVSEKTVPSSILRTVLTEVCDLLTKHSDILKTKHVEVAKTLEISEIVREIVQTHAMTKPTEFKRFLLKVVLLGDGGVGKTSLFNRFMGKGFKSDYLMTIGADFGVKKVNLPDQKEVKFLITDIAGQKHFKEVRKAFFSGTFGALIVVDVTRPETFKNTVHWLNEAWIHGPGPFPVIFLGNKNDLRSKVPTPVSHDKMRILADTLSKEAQKNKGFKIPYIPTSAKTGLNVDLAFETLGKEIVEWLLQHRLKKTHAQN